jgi:acyl-CoA thioesterase
MAELAPTGRSAEPQRFSDWREAVESDEILSHLRTQAEKEPVASFFRMRLVELAPGYAKVSLTVLPEYQNFNGTTFGGIIMSVADQAFGYASNSIAYPSLASQFNLYFLAAPKLGDELIAECRVVKSGRRVGVSEITVATQEGKLIARATGMTIPTGQK